MGSPLTIGLPAIGLFGVFLFLTYYLEEILRYSPVVTGRAFLPLIVALIASSTSVLGLWLVAALAVTGGRRLLRTRPMRWISRLAAVVMVVMAAVTLVEASG